MNVQSRDEHSKQNIEKKKKKWEEDRSEEKPKSNEPDKKLCMGL